MNWEIHKTRMELRELRYRKALSESGHLRMSKRHFSRNMNRFCKNWKKQFQ